MRMTPDAEESIRCSVCGCSCVCFKPGSVQLRSCDRCGHGWVAHALERLQAQPPSGCGPVEVALPGLVFDLSSLVLYGAQAVPVRLKILLDRLYSVLTPEQVGHILNTLGWSLGDYVRGYMLQFPGGKVLNRWLMVTPEEEMLILKQFLRFGETRPIVELMTLQCLEVANQLPDAELKPAPKGCQSNRGTLTVLRNPRGDSRLVAGLCGFERNSPSDHSDTVHHFENLPGGLSLLLPFHFGSSAFHCLVPPTKELVPPSKLTQCLRKPSGTKLAERHKKEGGRREEDDDQILQPVKDEPLLKIKADPDKLNPPRSLWQQNQPIHNDQELVGGETKQENTTSSSLYSPISSSSSSLLKMSQKMRGSPSSSLHPLPSFSSSFLCPLPTSTFSSSLHPPPSSSSSLHPLPSSLCSLPSPSPAGGRKGRVCCGVCGKSFYDKGTLKIHYNAVHLKIKHRCTVAGCTMVFSSLRSRNRHSANPNPRLHTGTIRDTNPHRNAHCDHTSIHSEAHEAKQANSNIHDMQTRMCRESTFWQQSDDAHKLNVHPMKNGLNGCQNNTPPQASSPSSSPHPRSQDTNHSFTMTNLQASPSLLLPAHSAPSLGSPPSLVPLVAPDKTEHHRHLVGPPLQPRGPAHCDGQSVSHGVAEGKRGEARTNQQWRWESADVTPKKKPRKSSMPVKIEREATESRNDEDEEG